MGEADRRRAGGREAAGDQVVTLEQADEILAGLREELLQRLGMEEIEARAAAGRILARPVVARNHSPPYDMATMDGYAVVAGDRPPLKVVGEVFAGRAAGSIAPGEAAYVATGAIMPAGAGAVLKVEDAAVERGVLRGPSVEQGDHVMLRGTDFRGGDRLLEAGTRLTAPAVGLLAAAGVGSVTVYRRPRVAVISTGDEIRNGQVPDFNAPLTCAILESWSCPADHAGTAGDDVVSIKALIDKSIPDHDVILTIGGVSAGKKDLTPDAVGRDNILFHGVKIKPGKPFMASVYRGKPVLSLPGKPVGTFTGLQLYVKKLLLGDSPDRWIEVPAGCDVELPAPGFGFVIYVELREGRACPIGYRNSSFHIFDGPRFDTSLLSAATRPTLADGYFIAYEHIKAGQPVKLYLL